MKMLVVWKRLNAAAGAALAAFLGMFAYLSLGCGGITETTVYPIGRRDSLVIVAVLEANGKTWASHPPRYAADFDGTVHGLYLDDMGLDILPGIIGSLDNLRDFSARKNRLRSLPAEIGDLPKLTRLWLDSNQLSSLPAAFYRLRLDILGLDWNHFTTLPLHVDSSLPSLSMKGNLMVSLPENLSSWSSLAYLDISHNQLGQPACPHPGVAFARKPERLP